MMLCVHDRKLHDCIAKIRVWVIVEGRELDVEGQKWRVASRGSQVEGQGLHVEGHRSRARKLRSRVKNKGSKFKFMFLIVLKSDVFLSVLVG